MVIQKGSQTNWHCEELSHVEHHAQNQNQLRPTVYGGSDLAQAEQSIPVGHVGGDGNHELSTVWTDSVQVTTRMSIFFTLLLDSSLPARPEINENNNDESIGKKIKYWFRIVDSINFTTTTTSTYRWCTFYSFRNKPLLHCILSM